MHRVDSGQAFEDARIVCIQGTDLRYTFKCAWKIRMHRVDLRHTVNDAWKTRIYRVDSRGTFNDAWEVPARSVNLRYTGRLIGLIDTQSQSLYGLAVWYSCY